MSPENDDQRETRAQLLGQYRDWLEAAAGLAPTTIVSYTAHTDGYLHWLAEKHPSTTLGLPPTDPTTDVVKLGENGAPERPLITPDTCHPPTKPFANP